MLTQTRLRELFDYNPETGIFTRRPPAKRKAGNRLSYFNKPAGSLHNIHGYVSIHIDGEKFRASRLAWLYMTGEWPQHEVDHINGNRANDSWANLREANSSEQKMNTAIRSDNTSGVKGIGWNKRQGKWHARIKAYGVQTHLGYFDDLEQAKAARKAAEVRIHGEFAKLDSLSINPTLKGN